MEDVSRTCTTRPCEAVEVTESLPEVAESANGSDAKRRRFVGGGASWRESTNLPTWAPADSPEQPPGVSEQLTCLTGTNRKIGELNSPAVKWHIKGLTGDFHLRHFFSVCTLSEGELNSPAVERLNKGLTSVSSPKDGAPFCMARKAGMKSE
eukprot:508795-Pyramimonas_sp.AAC.2